MIFLRCTNFLAEKRIQIPGERRLADLIRTQLNVCKNDLVSLANMHLPPELRARLDSLFEQDGGTDRDRLTLPKRIPQSTWPGKFICDGRLRSTERLTYDRMAQAKQEFQCRLFILKFQAHAPSCELTIRR